MAIRVLKERWRIVLSACKEDKNGKGFVRQSREDYPKRQRIAHIQSSFLAAFGEIGPL